ncbi:hypothetical protein C5U48_12790 [Mycolicibacter virginiensis]|uniref:Uncharacterized protein n=1 Tax=Mycolicibacter virginiensis TaxID=1795032 RepID=A0A9X7IM83_9MYCO|nr:hypothetical protein C5U48_12790 [Mycolicibacter virginiensis]
MTVDLGSGPVEYHVEDWWDRLAGGSWMFADGNPAAMAYAVRSAFKGLPIDNEVLYGKVGALGYLVHVSEIAASGQLGAEAVSA